MIIKPKIMQILFDSVWIEFRRHSLFHFIRLHDASKAYNQLNAPADFEEKQGKLEQKMKKKTCKFIPTTCG